jgi:glycosyltransferase involved in cell wall biosynthesis
VDDLRANMRKAPDLPDIAVLIPCYNEEAAIAAVIDGFRQALPDALIYVYDNNSSDKTIEKAEAAGAIIRTEPRQGKGNVIRRMFADVEADVYVMADGDATYDAERAGDLVAALLKDNLDMVVGTREPVNAETAYRPGHQFGNRLLTGTVGNLFGQVFTDMLSGYRVFSRRFVKSFPTHATGFETETEITIHALHLGMPVGEVLTKYYERPDGSESKLNTYRDGFRILMTIMVLLQEFRPFAFYCSIATVLAVGGAALSVPLFVTFLETGLVPRFPTAILVTGMTILACLSGVCGIILESVSRARLEAKRLAYLSIPAPGNQRQNDR